MNTNEFEKYGVRVPEILLPADCDLGTWSVIACDQFTQDYDYWRRADEIVGGKASTLRLILPEVYLNDKSEAGEAAKKERVKKIHETMDRYLADGVFGEAEKEFIYIERTTEYGRTRKGLVVAIDLETYEWKHGTKALIRATEQTVPERIPPRMEIRRGAKIESPHIMLLANDKDDLLVGKTGAIVKEEVSCSGDCCAKGVPIYKGDLMMNSGSIKGWAVRSDEALENVRAALEKLAIAGASGGSTGSPTANGTTEDDIFLFAVGDGNHSLATAKAVWDEHKAKLISEGASEEELKESPVRYALVEIVNIYDEALTFEPIHRIVFGADSVKLIEFLKGKLGGEISEVQNAAELEKLVASVPEALEGSEASSENGARFGFMYREGGASKCVLLKTKITELAISRLQPELDVFIKENPRVEIDYIHGAGDVAKLSEKDGATGLLLPPIAKESFFSTIASLGCLPRKSFSMGEASEKRFYVECRRLF